MKTKIVAFFVLPLIVAACNLPSVGPQQGNDFDAVSTYAAQTVEASLNQGQVQAAPTTGAQPNPSGQGSETTATSQSPQAGQTTLTPIPCNRASFVEDITIPDNTSITVGKAFTKTWKLKNVGSCTWTSGYLLVFDSGDQMGGPATQQLTNGTVAPGQTIEVSVNLVAPNSPGTYRGNWKLKDSGGVIFALSTGPFWVQIKAVAAPDWPTLKKGDSGNEVYAIQYLLLHHGQTPSVDGNFSLDTQSEVEDFQTQKNLLEDGIVGPETWQALIVTVKQGDTGPAVKAVQQLLKGKFGLNALAVDGIFGPQTAQAVKDFQTSKNITSDGIVGPITWQKLINN